MKRLLSTTRRSFLAALATGLLLSACATAPVLDDSGVDYTIMPKSVVNNLAATRGRLVLWGGMIVASKNLRDTTELEVLSYPLDKRQRPDLDANAGERFVIVQKGYLETADYAKGRLISVVATVVATREGMLDETRYTYPVVDARALHLWPRARAHRPDTHFHFGVGVIVN